MKIFIQIASYRDPQLVPTIEDAISKSKHPKNLVFGIARQYHPEDKFDDLSSYEEDKRFRVLNIPHEESKGVCWARNQVQQLYGGEEYTLQIDSHMRFDQDWDQRLIDMLSGLQDKGYKKPLLTGYVSSFDPENDPDNRIQEPWRMVFDRFIPEGVVFFLPETIPGWRDLTEPITARFYSAHFCFTLGQFSTEVQHDPEYYFHGEEISIAVRAYTHGYDLFHPTKLLFGTSTPEKVGQNNGMMINLGT
jgi:glycosyltransferase involved in cell wall biosynthesis